MSTLARSLLAIILATLVTALTTNFDAVLDHTVPFSPTRMILTFGIVLVLLMVLLGAMFPVREPGDQKLSGVNESVE